MTRDTIDMAREANLAKYGDGLREGVAAFINALERFEALVRADEREACAQIADGQLRNTNALLTYPPQSSAAYQIGVAIRARGNT
jgi:hypothetical protein